jgi:hypothetical protein
MDSPDAADTEGKARPEDMADMADMAGMEAFAACALRCVHETLALDGLLALRELVIYHTDFLPVLQSPTLASLQDPVDVFEGLLERH